VKRQWIAAGTAFVAISALLSYLAWVDYSKARTHVATQSEDMERWARLRERVDTLEKTVAGLRQRMERRGPMSAMTDKAAPLPGISAAAGYLNRNAPGAAATAAGAKPVAMGAKLVSGSAPASYAGKADFADDEEEGALGDDAANPGERMTKRLAKLQQKANLSDSQVASVSEALKTEHEKIAAIKQGGGGSAGAAGGKSRQDVQDIRRQTNEQIRDVLDQDQYAAYESMRQHHRSGGAGQPRGMAGGLGARGARRR
jgi:hypothetical protein